MWTTVTVVLLATSCSLAFPPRTIYNYKSDQLNHEQTGVAGRAVSGGYGWTAPNGQKFSVNYIADNKGYRIVSSQNVFPQESKPLEKVKPVAAAAAPKSFPSPPVAFAAPAKAKSTSFSFPSKSASSSFSSPQAKSSLARAHFGLSGSAFQTPQPQTTVLPTRRPITVIFFNTTPRPNKPSGSVVPVPTKVNRPVVGKQPSQPEPVAAEGSASEAEEPTAETAEGAEVRAAKSAKSVTATKNEAAPVEGTNAEGAEGAEAEGAEGAGAEGAESAGAEGAEGAGAEGAEGAEAEAGAEGGEGAEGEGGEEGGEGEGGEAGAEEGTEETEAQGEEGGEEEGEEEEGSEYGYEEEDEDESESSSAGEEW
ncbi:Insect cuticle protein [Trinorchestia longiramus]|nr:Insect cuticle protein [Trinorchestia longiramus]